MRKQDEAAEILRERIREEIYVPGIRLPSESILAEELGVNKVTLNKAIAKLVHEGFLERGSSTRDGTFVRESAKLMPKGTVTIVTHLLSSFKTRILAGIADAAARNNYHPILLCTTPENTSLAVAKAKAGGTRGIIYIACCGPDDKSFPTVYVDCDLMPEKEKYFCVNCDSRRGGEMLANALLGAGHRDIVYVANSQICIRENPRCSQFFRRLAEAGVTDTDQRFYSIAEPENTYPRLLRRILREHPHVTAIAAESDYIVMHLRKHAADMGSAFPAGVIYTGFGDIAEYQRFDPFPTISQEPYELGDTAVEMLVSIAEGKTDLSSPFTRIIPVELKGENYIRGAV